MSYTVEDLKNRGVEPTMRLLLFRIQQRATATYGEIARMLQRELDLGDHKVFPTHIGAVASDLMDRILTKNRTAPLINTLIVAQNDGLPSEGCYGYIERYLDREEGQVGKMPRADRVALIQELWREVFDYSKWDTVFEGVFDHPPEPANGTNLEAFTERDGHPGGWGGQRGGESQEHKRLKQHVLDNPECIGLAAAHVHRRRTEQPLLSGDSVDVFFSTENASYLVEVKSILSSEADLKRGLYQCLKYRVVLAAQLEKELMTDDIIVILVSEEDLPPDLAELAKRLGVKTCTVGVNR